jgi:hypothetical protein
MNYKIILDEQILRYFIEWLPELTPDETYYVSLFARNKYQNKDASNPISHIKSDKQQLKRFTTSRNRLFDKLKQCECEVGSYKQYKLTKEPVEVPQECLVPYITVNPRSFKKATKNGLIKFATLLANENGSIGYNPHAEVMSEIQKSWSRKPYFNVDIDIDDKENFDFDFLKGYININCISVLETRGGYHLLIKLDEIEEQYKRSWYQNIISKNKSFIDQTGDGMIPIPGCHQGGFMPNFVVI